MPQNLFDDGLERRAAHMRIARERARGSADVREASVVGAHGALFTSLRRGSIRADDRLDEESLIPMFSVSRNSVRGALKLLAEEGLVSRAPRRGTQVVAEWLDVPLSSATGWGPEPADRPGGRTYRVSVTDERWVSATPVARHHLRTSAERVHRTEATDLSLGSPAMLYTRYTLGEGAARPLVTGPEDDDFAALFARTYGAALGRVECWVEATHASRRTAARLQVPVGTPLIVRSRILEDVDGVPREYSISHYLASRVNMSAQAFEDCGDPVGTAPHPGPPLAERVADAATPDVEATDPGHRTAAELHTELRAAIRDGLLAVGDELDVDALARSYAARPEVVAHALEQLVEEGVAERGAGRAHPVVAAGIARLTLASARPYTARESTRFRNRQLSSAWVPIPRFLRGVLDGDSERAHRDERPMTIFVRYCDGDVVPARTLTSPRNGDFASLFEAAYGVPPGRVDSWVHAIRADEQIARRLRVATGSIVLLLERLTHDAEGRVRELSHSYINAGVVSLHISSDVVREKLPA